MAEDLKSQSLLPTGTPPEHGLAAMASLVDKVDDPVGKMWDAWTVPAAALPFLAWALRVPFWDETWPETKQRSVIAEAPELNATLGNVHAVKRIVEIAGGQVANVSLPPEGIYPGGGQTEQEFKDWLSRFAEIRIYDRPGEDTVLWDFLGETFLDTEGSFVAGYDPKPKRRAVLVDGINETELEVVEVRAHYSGGRTRIIEKLFGEAVSEGGYYVDHEYLGDHLDGAQDVFFLQIDDGVVLGRYGLDAELVSNRPATVTLTGEADDYFLGASCLSAGYLDRSITDRVIYQSYRLYDASRSHGATPGGFCLGDPIRFNLDANHMLVDVDASFVISDQASFPGQSFVSDYLVGDDGKHRKRMFDAVAAANPTSDRTLVSTALHRPVRFSDGLPFGSFKFGQLIKPMEVRNA